jgi:TfoX/Sxy family transcriptional regulator of competence genes
MAYNESLAARVRQLLKPKRVQEKKMMGGLTFMVNGKMCVGILKDNLMARIDPNVYEAALERPGCRPMDFTGKPMKGFVFIGPDGTGEGLKYWIDLALDFNSRAKASKKKETSRRTVRKGKGRKTAKKSKKRVVRRAKR